MTVVIWPFFGLNLPTNQDILSTTASHGGRKPLDYTA